jgi:hypothetical protein
VSHVAVWDTPGGSVGHGLPECGTRPAGGWDTPGVSHVGDPCVLRGDLVCPTWETRVSYVGPGVSHVTVWDTPGGRVGVWDTPVRVWGPFGRVIGWRRGT